MRNPKEDPRSVDLNPVINKLQDLWIPGNFQDGSKWNYLGLISSQDAHRYRSRKSQESFHIHTYTRKEYGGFLGLQLKEVGIGYSLERSQCQKVKNSTEHPFMWSLGLEVIEHFASRAHLLEDRVTTTVYLDGDHKPEMVIMRRSVAAGLKDSIGASLALNSKYKTLEAEVNYGPKEHQKITFKASKDPKHPYTLETYAANLESIPMAKYQIRGGIIHRVSVGGVYETTIEGWEEYLQRALRQVAEAPITLLQPFDNISSEMEHFAKQRLSVD